ncbi:zinc finger protein 616 isoform X1 [Drosophila persimilis]|uniref:zinc finger protein 616 isoform X1 n=1 Tax=Drosophila persimilis TaxID=7234 RepID=UPI000F090DFD|nr:zinc finger protein 616 isoform X1 [Drosophila persimilis]
MSENPKTSRSGPSCLHCSAFGAKLKYQEIFDEFGLELGLKELLAKHFSLDVTPNAKQQQLLCDECVNVLIRLFDIDELQKEQDAAIARRKSAVQDAPAPKSAPKTPPNAARIASKTAPNAATSGSHTPPNTAQPVKPTAKKAVLPEPQTKVEKPVPVIQPDPKPSRRIIKNVSVPLPSAASVADEVDKVKAPSKTKHAPKEADQEQISALILNILNEDEPGVVDESETVLPDSSQTTIAVPEKEAEAEAEAEVTEEEDLDGMNIIYEHEDISIEEEVNTKPDIRPSRLKRQKTESQSEADNEESEASNIVLFNFVEIKEKDDIDDLYEYLATVVRTSFEKLKFNWNTVCQHCTLKSTSYENLLEHMLRVHKSRSDVFRCPIEGCNLELKGRKLLAMHLVVLHAPVADIAIYGSCPECKMTFSNILQYNKHSCAHIIKKKRGVRLFCEMCALEFPSWKRFNFHNQFHLEKHRPRACFVCGYENTNIDELFQHLHYSHEPEGTLFCDLCDRTFRDPAVFIEHNTSHATVGNATYTCGECLATFETRGKLNSHTRSMHGNVISCELCSREFASEATYNVHMKSHLIIERSVHVCGNCGQLSENQEKMDAHFGSEGSACFGAERYVELLRDAYVCEYCTTYFKQKSDLQSHRETGVHDNGVFSCQPCGKDFTDMKLYRHHWRNYQQLRVDVAHRKLDICTFFMCDQKDCSAAYANWNSLYTHKRRTHDESKERQEKSAKPLQEWQCQFCLKLCRSKMSLSVHVARSHNNDNVVCSLCNASYKSKDALDKHFAYWHEPIECPQCFKIVKNRRNYDTHVNVVHSNKKRYTCSVCEKGFYHKSEMEAHKRLHSQSYSCEQCSFTTRNKKSLSVHTLGQHFKRFAFDCKMCDKHFGRRQGLTNHIQRVHASKHVCRNYIDDGCGRSFTTSSQLNVHLRKVHNSTLVADDVLEEEAYAIARPPAAKKRCFGILKDKKVEFIDDSAVDMDTMKDVDYNVTEEEEEEVEHEEVEHEEEEDMEQEDEECALEFAEDEAEGEPKPNRGSNRKHGRKLRSDD